MSTLDASLRKTWELLRARKQLQNALLDQVRLIARIAGRLETEAAHGEMAAFSLGLTEQIEVWRQAGAR